MIPVIPSSRALWLLALVSPFFLVSVPGSLAADVVICGLLFWDGRRARPPRVSRRVPEIMALTAPAEVLVEVTNPGGRVVHARVTDDIDPRLERSSEDGQDWNAGLQVRVPPGETVVCRYLVRPLSRGFLQFGNIHLRTSGPLGLAWLRTTLPAAGTTRVQPGIGDLMREKKYTVRRPLEESGPRRIRMYAEGSEFESLREYRQGDDPRTIDWKASARRGLYVVRNYQAERGQHVVLAIDAGCHMRETIQGKERADTALAACMLLASRAEAYSDRLGLMVFDEQVRHLSPPARVNLARVAETLAGVETRSVESNYPLAMAMLGRTFRKRALVVLFSDVIDQTVSRALVRALAGVARVHLPLAVTIGNPKLQETARQDVYDEAGAFRRAAAWELVHARALALEAMHRSGILVVDVSPCKTLAATLDRYVQVKEQGLL